MKVFSPKWISWVVSFILGGSAAINVNGEVGPYFQTIKGLRQGDPPPILFNMVADMLAKFYQLSKGRGSGRCGGAHLRDGVLSISQYADDTILFMEHDLEKAQKT